MSKLPLDNRNLDRLQRRFIRHSDFGRSVLGGWQYWLENGRTQWAVTPVVLYSLYYGDKFDFLDLLDNGLEAVVENEC